MNPKEILAVSFLTTFLLRNITNRCKEGKERGHLTVSKLYQLRLIWIRIHFPNALPKPIPSSGHISTAEFDFKKFDFENNL